MKPLESFKWPHTQGMFGARRKHDIHTGIDLYAEPGDKVFAIERGRVVDVGIFTGPVVGTPFWNETGYIVICGSLGYILYGELITPLAVGAAVKEGDVVGNIVAVLKEDRGLPMSMLHLEWYLNYEKPVEWLLNQPRPDGLLDPSYLLTR